MMLPMWIAVLLCSWSSVFAGIDDGVTSGSFAHDFVLWWGYARFPIATFILFSSLLTWIFIYQNRHRFQLIEPNEEKQKKISVFYGTQTGNAKYFAEQLEEKAKIKNVPVSLHDMNDVEPEDRLIEEVESGTISVFIISTYTEGTPPDKAKWFCKYLREASDDFRVQKSLLHGLQYTIFGLGNSIYENNYNTVAKQLDGWLCKLSAQRVYPVALGDENVSREGQGNLTNDFNTWATGFLNSLNKAGVNSTMEEDKSGCNNAVNGKCCQRKDEKDLLLKSEQKKKLYESDSENESESTGCKSGGGDTKDGGLVDVEDIGNVMKYTTTQQSDEFDEAFVGESVAPSNREMITPLLKKSLEKQGYKLIGSHSGVKICRWTKSMMRGRGGCYKHTFYGIESHRCMETTPSLACANKCVFCWRHHTNPVGTEWKWKMDPPQQIVEGALQNHYKMVKQFKGVPGVRSERYSEAMNVQHCALSLVGEPIMYPEINSLIDLLHIRKISTFLVTNAQFPEAIRSLKPVTQLYVSVDASTKDSLKKIDRPLFKDFWQRFLDSLTALSDKGQRTVYRLTLVKAFNTEEIEAYAKLVDLGKPGFIEIKGVTYCGESKASNLTMENVPWHEEVVGFVKQLAASLPDYELASEHEHSNCVLLAHKRFYNDGRWNTWIDYPKYHQLMKNYEESNGTQTFRDTDYMAPTPSWAVFGDEHRGFDPDETRWHRKKKKDISGC